MNSACPITLIRLRASHFPGKANTQRGKEKWGNDIGNSDVPQFSPPPPSFPSLFIVRGPNKVKVNVVKFSK